MLKKHPYIHPTYLQIGSEPCMKKLRRNDFSPGLLPTTANESSRYEGHLDRMLLNIHGASSRDHCTSVQIGGMKIEKKRKKNSFLSGCVYSCTYYFLSLFFPIAQAVSFKSLCESCCHLQAVGWWWDLFKHSLLESTPNVKAICSTHLKITSSLNVLH